MVLIGVQAKTGEGHMALIIYSREEPSGGVNWSDGWGLIGVAWPSSGLESGVIMFFSVLADRAIIRITRCFCGECHFRLEFGSPLQGY